MKQTVFFVLFLPPLLLGLSLHGGLTKSDAFIGRIDGSLLKLFSQSVYGALQLDAASGSLLLCPPSS